MPNKRHSMFELCDTNTSYILPVSLYNGQNFEIRSAEGQASVIVKHLLDVCGVFGKGIMWLQITFTQKFHLQETLLKNCLPVLFPKIPRSPKSRSDA